jgi:hypothetical protein
LEREEHGHKKDIMNEYPRMISIFQQLEENILKSITIKETTEKEIENDEEKFKAELYELQIRENKLKDEEAKLLHERIILEKSSKELNRVLGGGAKDTEIKEMIKDLHLTLIADGEKVRKTKKEINHVKELTEDLKVIITDKENRIRYHRLH